MTRASATPLLKIRDLTIDLRSNAALRRVVRDVDLTIGEGEAVGLVGESGSGKSMTARSIMRLLPNGAVVGGDISFDNRSVQALSPRELTQLRSRDVAMIFQDARAHMNPVKTIGSFLIEGLVARGDADSSEARRRACDVLTATGFDAAPERLDQYPHEFSGGMLQRVMIAAALLAEPRLIIADEPTSALDVTTQAEVIEMLDRQRRDRGLALLFITHDLDLAAAVCDRTAVMYAGCVVEEAESEELDADPLHPYTVGLLASRPTGSVGSGSLNTIPGRPLAAFEAPVGCPFATRCVHVMDKCLAVRPELTLVKDRLVACHLHRRGNDAGSE